MKMYNRSEMLYDYKWRAISDHDNPHMVAGAEHLELNRTEGYEVLYFINELAKTFNWTNKDLLFFQNIERAIRDKVPPEIHKHSEIKQWLFKNDLL